MSIPPIVEGYKRQWTRCKECGNVAYYDYVPFSLSNPVSWLPCGHGISQKIHEAADYITADEALQALAGE